MDIGVILCAIVVVGAFFLWMTDHEKKVSEAEKVNQAHKHVGEQLESTYRMARLSGDRAKALEAGRLYYAHLRGGTLTIYDEQALANDLAAMGSRPE